tara:strand:+ start:437 stop:670 length:234 start_codon:yes stop_codon:yes gene_type:complete
MCANNASSSTPNISSGGGAEGAARPSEPLPAPDGPAEASPAPKADIPAESDSLPERGAERGAEEVEGRVLACSAGDR